MRLHTVRRSDVERLAAWLPAVAEEAQCPRWTPPDALHEAIGGLHVLTNDDRSAFIAFQTAAPEADAAQVDFLAVVPGQRRLGIGASMALGVERRLKSKAERLYALVPASIGLALYFWLRLGYRPLARKDSPPMPSSNTSVWMVRSIP